MSDDVYIIGIGIHPFGRTEGMSGRDQGVFAARQALADAVQRLRENRNLSEALGQAARQRALDHYTWEARVRNIRAHLERAKIVKGDSHEVQHD